MIKNILVLLFLLVFLNDLQCQVPEGIPKAGLQGLWLFSGNPNDVSGKNRHGRPNDIALVEDRFGNRNGAYKFNGYSSFIETDYKGILGGHPRSISFWANAGATKSPGAVIVAWGDDALFPSAGGRFNCCFGGCFVCKPGDNFIGPTIETSDAGATYEGHEPVTDGKWHHYVYRFKGKTIQDVEIYQDGRLLTHEPYRFYENSFINTKQKTPVTFGALFISNDTASYFNGVLDDVAIYDRALDVDEINALYTAVDPHKKIDFFKWVPLILGVLAFILLIIWFIRLRVKKLVRKEKQKIQLEKKWFEQENRVLKAQMDPHFIFNSLNSIQQFIIVNDNEKAQLYLSTFAQLIRMQLESNTNENITLKQELEILEKYLEIESLRFNNAFDHEIVVDKTIDTAAIFIPYFLIQPFVENAIHHGLLPKIGYKELTITIEMPDDKMLRCIVEDNGIGRKNSARKDVPFKTKSLGVNFVEQRLLIMSKIENRKYGVVMTDKEDENGKSIGTHAVITMPIQTKP